MTNPKPTQAEDGDVDEVLATLIHTYLAKITKPANNTELEAYNKKVAKLQNVAKNKLLSLKSTWQAETRREMLEKLPEKLEDYIHPHGIILCEPDGHLAAKYITSAINTGYNEAIDLMRERLEK